MRRQWRMRVMKAHCVLGLPKRQAPAPLQWISKSSRCKDQQTNRIMKLKPSVLSLNICSASSIALLAAVHFTPVRAAVVPPDQLVAGKSYSDWTAAWWQWALQIPDDGHHPLKDRTGADALRNQSGPVWFFGPVANASSAVRDIVVPDDKTLFVNIVTVECSTLESPPFYGSDEAELRSCAEGFPAVNLFCQIDGVSVQDLVSFHFTSPLFGFTLPGSNILGVTGGGQGQAVASGVSVLIEPLSPGSHTIHFRGGHAGYNDTVDVTYRITVVPRPTMAIRPLPGTNLIELSWPLMSGFSLQQADSLDVAATWTAASMVSTSLTNGVQFATVTNAPTHRFFRLSQP